MTRGLLTTTPIVPLRVLLVEDSRADAELLVHELRARYDVTSTRVDTAAGLRDALGAGPWDVILSDYSMPGFSAPDALALVHESGLDIPFIIVSGTIGEETAVASLKAGACDFLVKGRLARLIPAIERECRERDLRRERARAHDLLQEQLRQAHKMEAIGQLAGGVAHDFNNMLTAILGYAEMLCEQIGPDKSIGKDLRQIVSAAERASALTRQLLAFGRKQTIKPAVLSLNTVVEGLEPMLRRLIPENVVIQTALDGRTWAVRADPVQLEQVLMNLVVNGRDAMPGGGVLRIETRNATRRQLVDARPQATPSTDHVVLRVSDTGVGIPADVVDRIFEPFFTTKDHGRGTGLGLAAVQGIVGQLGGFITVDSAPGRGTRFDIFLPKADQMPDAQPVAAEGIPDIGSETVLLVEDDAAVRGFARTVLQRHGYRVQEAESSEAALARLAADTRGVDLLLTDLILTGMNGAELARSLGERQPSLRVLFMSGYGDAAPDEALPEAADVLVKPFTAHTLLARVRRALDARARS
jgi:two-component system, cell cycle sensor histidine kinase and response regulator CckA